MTFTGDFLTGNIPGAWCRRVESVRVLVPDSSGEISPRFLLVEGVACDILVGVMSAQTSLFVFSGGGVGGCYVPPPEHTTHCQLSYPISKQ